MKLASIVKIAATAAIVVAVAVVVHAAAPEFLAMARDHMGGAR